MKNFLSLLFLCAALLGKAQSPYVFELDKVNYSSIENISGSKDTMRGVWIKPGFSYRYLGFELDSIYCGLQSVEFILPNMVRLSAELFLSDSIENIPGRTTYLYNTIGPVGSRVFVWESKDVGFDKNPNDYINLQFRFYEESSSFEVHFGPQSISPNNPILVGIDSALSYFGEFDISDPIPLCYWVINLHSEANNPVVNSNCSEDSVKFLTSIPSEGTVYRFAYRPEGIQSGKSKLANLFELVSSNQGEKWRLQGPSEQGVEYKIMSVNGQLKAKGSIQGGNAEIDALNWAKGLYILEISGQGHKEVHKLLR